MNDPTNCNMRHSVFYKSHPLFYGFVILSAIGVAGYSLWEAPQWVDDPCGIHTAEKAALYGIWVLLPPIWFFVEYFCLFRRGGRPCCFEAFKYGQELASRIWLAIATILGVLFFGKELIGKG